MIEAEYREADAIATIARAAENEATAVGKRIKAIPRHLVTPELIASLAAALSTLCEGLPEEPRGVAQNYLDDLYSDMKGFAND